MSRKRPVISVGCDHAAVNLRKNLVAFLKEQGHEVVDRGVKSARKSVDYPDYAKKVVDDVLGGTADLGILICGTGIGMSMAANRHRGIRAALVHDLTTAQAAAKHNHANVLCLGARLLAPELARSLVQAWLETPREARHKKRLDLMEKLADGCDA